MVFCHWAWFKVLTVFPAPVAALGTLAIPVVGVVASALWLGEPLGLQEAAALGFVIGGLAIVLLLPQRSRE